MTLIVNGEEVDPRSDVWRIVFDVISHMDYENEKELIRLLEEAREEDGYGPQI